MFITVFLRKYAVAPLAEVDLSDWDRMISLPADTKY